MNLSDQNNTLCANIVRCLSTAVLLRWVPTGHWFIVKVYNVWGFFSMKLQSEFHRQLHIKPKHLCFDWFMFLSKCHCLTASDR